jgi:hypothetical protein
VPTACRFALTGAQQKYVSEVEDMIRRHGTSDKKGTSGGGVGGLAARLPRRVRYIGLGACCVLLLLMMMLIVAAASR